MLFTQLDGFKLPEPGSSNFHNYKDPLNYKSISVEQIADTLNLKKKKVRKSIDLIDSLYLIECGSNETVKNGYRFTF